MSKQQIIRHSLPDIIAEEISKQIIDGTLQPGDNIVESTYAEKFGTSRAPVREALYLLAVEGLVERIPRKGTIVKGYSEDEMHNLLEIRMFLEKLAISKATSTWPDETFLSKMESLIPQMKKAMDDFETYSRLNREFHEYIIQISQSTLVKDMYDRLGLPLLSLQKMSFKTKISIEKSIHEHSLMIQYLQEGNVEEASRVLQRHNEDSIESIKAILSKRSTD